VQDWSDVVASLVRPLRVARCLCGDGCETVLMELRVSRLGASYA
jgi:hypothetical protein